MILLNRLKKFGADKEYFSELQFHLREEVGFIETSFSTLEATNNMLEQGSKVFRCFLEVCKAFDTVLAWLDGSLFKLFSELGIKGRMWL